MIDIWREQERVKANIKLAIKSGLPATLTLEEWLETIEYCEHRCAYCQIVPFALLEHILPDKLGGGTTKENCVPACSACNAEKRGCIPFTPDERLDLLDKIRRVNGYIQAREYCRWCDHVTFHASDLGVCIRCGHTPKTRRQIRIITRPHVAIAAFGGEDED